MVDEKDTDKKEETKETKAVSTEQVEQEAPLEPEVEKTPTTAAPATFDEISQTGRPTNVNDNIERILDIPVTVAVEVGRVKMLINDLLQLGHGSVIELEKAAGEPMEILVNDRLVAKGEVVAINEKFGIRLTDIISPTERIKQLRK